MVSDAETVGQAMIDRAVDALASGRSVQIWLTDIEQPYRPTEISSYAGATILRDAEGGDFVVRTANVAHIYLGPLRD